MFNQRVLNKILSCTYDQESVEGVLTDFVATSMIGYITSRTKTPGTEFLQRAYNIVSHHVARMSTSYPTPTWVQEFVKEFKAHFSKVCICSKLINQLSKSINQLIPRQLIKECF